MLSLNISKLITDGYGVFLVGIVVWLHQEVKTWPNSHPQNQDGEQEPPRGKNAASAAANFARRRVVFYELPIRGDLAISPRMLLRKVAM